MILNNTIIVINKTFLFVIEFAAENRNTNTLKQQLLVEHAT